jgi:hypothetical protein
MSRKNFDVNVTRDPATGWVRMSQLPIGRTLAVRLIKEGKLISALLGAPGTKRGVRLVSLESFENYVRSLAE